MEACPVSEIHKTVTIGASVEKVLAFLDDPKNVPKYAPNVERVADIMASERRIGSTFRVTYKALGMTFDERFTVTGSETPPITTPHRRFQIRQSFAGRMTGSLTWTLDAQDNETEASVDIEYELVGGVLGEALDVLVLRRNNERNAEVMLENIKLVLAPYKVSTRQ